jgi:predicted RNase H-like HicB family nuclease
MNNTICDSYSYSVIWSDDDNEFVGLYAEFTSLSWLAETLEEALQGIKDIVADVVTDVYTNL